MLMLCQVTLSTIASYCAMVLAASSPLVSINCPKYAVAGLDHFYIQMISTIQYTRSTRDLQHLMYRQTCFESLLLVLPALHHLVLNLQTHYQICLHLIYNFLGCIVILEEIPYVKSRNSLYKPLSITLNPVIAPSSSMSVTINLATLSDFYALCLSSKLLLHRPHQVCPQHLQFLLLVVLLLFYH